MSFGFAGSKYRRHQVANPRKRENYRILQEFTEHE
jgi:hypothetical protein